MIRTVVALGALALAACFNPSFDHPQCGPAGECPSGSVCVGGTCEDETPDVDAPIDTASTSDGGPDAPTIDAPTIDAPTIDAPTIDAPTIDAPAIDAPGPFCGDGVINGSEQCDDGNMVDTDNCRNNCMTARCGDGVIDRQAPGVEVCDDGNLSNNDDCRNDCALNVCGDGFVDTQGPVTEACDDGNLISTDACLNTCVQAFCGDGFIRTGVEACDDRNGLACGTCNAGCTAALTPRAASGTVTEVPAGSHVDGELLVIDDGINPPTTFEYDVVPPTSPGRVRVNATGGGPGVMANELANAINSVPATLLVTAMSLGGGQVALTHDRATGAGNRPLLEMVQDPGFTVAGMSGGAAVDCPTNTGCISNNDCLSGVCNVTNSLCQ